MKTLGKLNINSKKIIKTEELVTLRGGTGSPCMCYCLTWWDEKGYLLSPTGNCIYECDSVWPGSFGGCVQY